MRIFIRAKKKAEYNNGMLDIKYIREHALEVKKNGLSRQSGVDIDELLRVDEEHRTLRTDVEGFRKQRNDIANDMRTAAAERRDGLITKGKELKRLLAVKEAELAEVEARWMTMLVQVPNLTHPDTPIGASDHENAEIRVWGEKRDIKNPKNHVEIADEHDLIDWERGAKVAGNKFYYLKGKLMILEQALIRFALDEVMNHGFIPMTTPDLARDEIISGAGFSPRGAESQIYSIENHDLSLIGTSEIALAGYHEGETLSERDLPLRYAGFSHCYRTEAGTYGRESYGLYRVHQFSKVEMFVFSTPAQSEAMLHEIVRIEEGILRKLGLPYRVVDCCTADLSAPAYRKFDIEVWLPGKDAGEGARGAYGEITSASNCTDYQARRLGIKLKGGDGKATLCHTLNGTALPTSRAMVAILENYQEPDGSVSVPQALVPYCGFGRVNGS